MPRDNWVCDDGGVFHPQPHGEPIFLAGMSTLDTTPLSDAHAAGAPHRHEVADDAAPALRPLFRLDAGWLFLLAGLAVLSVTVLIPAARDLEEARWQRNRALAIERHREQRLNRYGQYLSAVQRGEEDVVLSLMATQLNVSPVGRVPLLDEGDPGRVNASVFPSLEPDPVELPARPDADKKPSILTRLTTNDHHRLWLLAGGVVCVLIGLLPPVMRNRL